MLILWRRPTESIDFPQLGISVSVVSVKGSRVQVGIDAPPEIWIKRRELEASSPEIVEGTSAASGTSSSQITARQVTHEFKNRLNQATLGLHLAQKQLAAGIIESANKTLTTALARLAELEQAAVADSIHSRRYESPSPSHPADRKRDPAQNRFSNESPESFDVLLVEDDQNEQALLRGILEMEGYRVQTAGNGHEALACLRRCTPRFVLLDMMMPKCNGRETLEQIRQDPAWRYLPVFAVSGSSPDSLGLPIGSAGVDDWFPKPLNPHRLVQLMRERVADLCV